MNTVVVYDRDGWRRTAVLDGIMKPAVKRPVVVKAIQMNKKFRVFTLEGVMEGAKGDYLIKGVDDELYPCKASIFEKTYDIIEEED